MNYSNSIDSRPFTMADIEATRRKVEAMGPPPETEATVSPAMLEALKARPDFDELFVGHPFPGIHLHVDDRLPAGTWHKGPPRA